MCLKVFLQNNGVNDSDINPTQPHAANETLGLDGEGGDYNQTQYIEDTNAMNMAEPDHHLDADDDMYGDFMDEENADKANMDRLQKETHGQTMGGHLTVMSVPSEDPDDDEDVPDFGVNGSNQTDGGGDDNHYKYYYEDGDGEEQNENGRDEGSDQSNENGEYDDTYGRTEHNNVITDPSNV